MKHNYVSSRAKVKRIITKWGEANIIVKKGITGGHDKKGNVIPDAPDSFINGIITPLTKYKVAQIDGKSIITGDAFAYFSSDKSHPSKRIN